MEERVFRRRVLIATYTRTYKSNDLVLLRNADKKQFGRFAEIIHDRFRKDGGDGPHYLRLYTDRFDGLWPEDSSDKPWVRSFRCLKPYFYYHSAIFALRAWGELDLHGDEIKERYGLPPENVRKRLHRQLEDAGELFDMSVLEEKVKVMVRRGDFFSHYSALEKTWEAALDQVAQSITLPSTYISYMERGHFIVLVLFFSPLFVPIFHSINLREVKEKLWGKLWNDYLIWKEGAANLVPFSQGALRRARGDSNPRPTG